MCSGFLGDSVINISVYKYGMNSRQEASSPSNTIHLAVHSITYHNPVIPTIMSPENRERSIQ